MIVLSGLKMGATVAMIVPSGLKTEVTITSVGAIRAKDGSYHSVNLS